MINFNFDSIKDNNGFIRLSNINNLDKFVNIWKRMSITTPCNPNDALYKDYNVTTTSATHGTYNFKELCEADVFIRRIKKSLPTGYVMWSNIPESKYYGIKPSNARYNTFFYIYGYDYCNTRKADSQTLVIKYIDFNGDYGKIFVNVSELKNIVFKVMSDDDVNKYKEYLNFVNQKPEPIWKLMIMKQEYKDDYNVYLADCKKYGFEPINKKLIKAIRIEFEDTVTTFTLDGKLGWAPDGDDTIVVNY